MIDHMTFRVSDMQRAQAFYDAALAPLGHTRVYDATHDGVRVLGYGSDGKIDTWLVDGPSDGSGGPTTGCHLAWRAASRSAVDAFHAGALAAGGRDHGAPGLRPHYHDHYYGAFVIDPDGNNVEAVCHEPA